MCYLALSCGSNVLGELMMSVMSPQDPIRHPLLDPTPTRNVLNYSAQFTGNLSNPSITALKTWFTRAQKIVSLVTTKLQNGGCSFNNNDQCSDNINLIIYKLYHHNVDGIFFEEKENSKI